MHPTRVTQRIAETANGQFRSLDIFRPCRPGKRARVEVSHRRHPASRQTSRSPGHQSSRASQQSLALRDGPGLDSSACWRCEHITGVLFLGDTQRFVLAIASRAVQALLLGRPLTRSRRADQVRVATRRVRPAGTRGCPVASLGRVIGDCLTSGCRPWQTIRQTRSRKLAKHE